MSRYVNSRLIYEMGSRRILSRRRRGVIPLLGILSFSCSNANEPASLVSGVWVGRVAPFDSLRLVIVETAGRLQGYGHLYPLVTPDFGGSGTRTGSHIELTLNRMAASYVIRAGVYPPDDRLLGTITGFSATDTVVAFNRSPPVVAGLPGNWVLGHISDTTALDIPRADTILLAGDGHLRRFVSRASGCAATRYGFYRRQNSVAIIYYFDLGLPSLFDCGIDTGDTLSLVGATLVRRTPVSGGGQVEETYVRK